MIIIPNYYLLYSWLENQCHFPIHFNSHVNVQVFHLIFLPHQIIITNPKLLYIYTQNIISLHGSKKIQRSWNLCTFKVSSAYLQQGMICLMYFQTSYCKLRGVKYLNILLIIFFNQFYAVLQVSVLIAIYSNLNVKWVRIVITLY